MVRQHHWLKGHEFEQTLGDGEGQGRLVCGSSRGHKESDVSERLDNNSDKLWSHHGWDLLRHPHLGLPHHVRQRQGMLMTLYYSLPVFTQAVYTEVPTKLFIGLAWISRKEMATHSSILAWKIPWREEPGGLQATGLQSRAQLTDSHFYFPTLAFGKGLCPKLIRLDISEELNLCHLRFLWVDSIWSVVVPLKK